MNEKAQIVIIGGGVIGLSIAYHLGHLGIRDVILFERNQLTSGTSWHAAGIVGPLRASMNLTLLAKYAIKLFQELEVETGQATGYRQTGGLWLAQRPDRLTELRRICAMGDRSGLDTEMISASEIKERFTMLYTDDLCGGMWVEQDGQVNPVDLCMAYAKGARANGVTIRENASIVGVESLHGAVSAITLVDGSRIECDKVVNCAGAWARHLGELSGVNIPLIACEHIYLVTEPIAELPKSVPIVRDLENSIYIKEDSGKLVLGTFESNPKHWQSSPDDDAYLMFDEDWDHTLPMLESGMHRLPAIAEHGIAHFMNGPESFTPDTRQIMGEAPELKNYFVAAGFNSIGIMSSAGVGKVMAEWIRDGEAPNDLWEVDIARLDPLHCNDQFLIRRLPESVFNQFDMHWPGKQYKSGRGLRLSPWHEQMQEQGGVFGAPTGWERPLYFASSEHEKNIQYSYGEQSWWPAARREALHCQAHVSLFELSPFTKIEMHGSDVVEFLQKLCCGDIDVRVGQAKYTLMLNHRGGIEAEVTLTKIDSNTFWLTSGAATRFKDLFWLKKHLDSERDVQIVDITEDHAVLGVMGPDSRKLMRRLSDSDFSDDAFAFSSARQIKIDGCEVMATRLSFVGELGWELSIPVRHASQVYQHIVEQGKRFDLGHAGHYCLDSCRLEKAYLHWGHDMGSEDTPFEVGLGFTVCFDKSAQFIGRKTLIEQKKRGWKKQLLLCEVLADSVLILHDEPVYFNDEIIGHCTSGGKGFRINKTLCFIMICKDINQSIYSLSNHTYQIEIAGKKFKLRVLAKPPYPIKGNN